MRKDFRRDVYGRTYETFYRTVPAWARSRRRDYGEEVAEESAMREHSREYSGASERFARWGELCARQGKCAVICRDDDAKRERERDIRIFASVGETGEGLLRRDEGGRGEEKRNVGVRVDR